MTARSTNRPRPQRHSNNTLAVGPDENVTDPPTGRARGPGALRDPIPAMISAGGAGRAHTNALHHSCRSTAQGDTAVSTSRVAALVPRPRHGPRGTSIISASGASRAHMPFVHHPWRSRLEAGPAGPDAAGRPSNPRSTRSCGATRAAARWLPQRTASVAKQDPGLGASKPASRQRNQAAVASRPRRRCRRADWRRSSSDRAPGPAEPPVISTSGACHAHMHLLHHSYRSRIEAASIDPRRREAARSNPRSTRSCPGCAPHGLVQPTASVATAGTSASAPRNRRSDVSTAAGRGRRRGRDGGVDGPTGGGCPTTARRVPRNRP